MSNTLLRIAGLLPFVVMTATSASAQDASPATAAPPAVTDRATVKNDARQAEAAGTMPHGDLPIPAATPSTPATDRTAMKKDTAAYTKAKQPAWMPNNGPYNQGNTMKSVADRSTVKAATKDAEKNQQIPRGQAAQPATSTQ